MTKKLTILVKEKNIRFAKAEAKRSNTTVSAMFDSYLERMYEYKNAAKRKDAPAWLKKYAGALPGVSNE